MVMATAGILLPHLHLVQPIPLHPLLPPLVQRPLRVSRARRRLRQAPPDGGAGGQGQRQIRQGLARGRPRQQGLCPQIHRKDIE